MKGWRFIPFANARDDGVLVTPQRRIVAARFLTPAQAKAETK